MKLSAVVLAVLPTIAAGAVRTANVSPQRDIDYGILEVPSGCEAIGSAFISQEFANQLLGNADLPPISTTEGNVIPTRLLTETLNSHTDRIVSTGHPVGVGSSVAFIPVNENENAFFVHGNERLPLVKDRMYQFDGSIEHGIIIDSGNVQLLGPFELPSLNPVGCIESTPCSEREIGECCSQFLGPEECKICTKTSSEDIRRRLSKSDKTKTKKSKGGDEAPTCELECIDADSSGDTCYDCILPKPFFNFIPGPLEDVAGDQTRIAEIVKDLGGNMEGNFGIVEDLLPLHELGNLRDHADYALENMLAAVDEAERKDILEDFRFDLSPSELVALTSLDSVRSLYVAFKDYADDFPVTRIIIRRTYLNGEKHIQYHNDKDTAVMHVWLNEDGVEGGNLVYLNNDGATKIETKPGAAALHKDRIVHGITPLNGTRYILILLADNKVDDDVLVPMVT